MNRWHRVRVDKHPPLYRRSGERETMGYESESSSSSISVYELFKRKCVWKIITVLLDSPACILNISALISRTGLSHSTMTRCLDIMKKFDIVEVSTIGRLKLVRLNVDNELVKIFMQLLRNTDITSSLSS